jgi:SAM-dependent methyltransferase
MKPVLRPDNNLNQTNKSAWDRLYASTTHSVWGSTPVGFLAEHLPSADKLPPGGVLDAATGEGRNLPPLIALGRPVSASDSSAAALAKIPAPLRQSVTLVESDLAQLPLPDASFAFILLCDVVETLPEPVAVIRELRRLMVPGGLLLVNIPGDDDGIAGIDMQPVQTTGWLYQGRYYYRFYSRAEAESLLVEAGLELVESRVSTWQEEAHPHYRSEAHTHTSLILTARRPAR